MLYALIELCNKIMEVSYFGYSGSNNMNNKYMLKSDVEHFTNEDDKT